MNIAKKIVIFALVALYIISPVDLCPGPIDDIILLLGTIISYKAKAAIKD